MRSSTKYNIEKIKTIGDSYMCAGGLPVPNKTNAADVINAGLDIRDFMLRRRSDNSYPGFEIRIGVHSGPVIAGIVGNKNSLMTSGEIRLTLHPEWNHPVKPGK